MKGWIYQLSKVKLVAELDRLGLDSTGNLDVLRQRIREYVNANPEYEYSDPEAAETSESTEITSEMDETEESLS